MPRLTWSGHLWGMPGRRSFAAMAGVIIGLASAAQTSAGPAATEPASPVTASMPAGDVPAVPTSQPTGRHRHLKTEGSDLADLQLLNLDVPTVITASRHEQKLNAVPYAMSVITKEDIRLAGARSVPDALRLVPGMDVAELSYGHTVVSPRGLPGVFSRQSLVLVDGRSIFDSVFSGVLWGAWPFQLEDIERIEVIRGPAGVTWGANAVNGVINIITKDPAEQKGLTVIGGGGSRGVGQEYVGGGIQVDKLRLRVSETYERTDGFRKGGSFLRPLEDDYKAGIGNVHMVYDYTPNDTLTLSGGSGVTADSTPPTPLGNLGHTPDTGSEASYIMGRWNHRIAPDNRVDLTAFVNDFGWRPGLRAMDYRYQQLAFQLAHTFKPAEEHTFTWGFDSRVDLIDASNADPRLLSKDRINSAIVGLYAQDEWRLAPRWTFTLGGRIDYDNYGGFEPSARASLAYELTRNSSLYGAVSRSYVMPAAGMRFWDMPVYMGLVHFDADRDMHAVTEMSYEVGHRARFFDRLDTNLALFCLHTPDDIVSAPGLGPPGLVNINLHNGADILCYGLEWEGKWAITDRFTLLGNYTFELTDWGGGSTPLNSDQIVAPKNKFMVGARYNPIKDLYLSGHMYYVDNTESPNPANPMMLRHIPAYLRLDLRAEYEFLKDRGSVAVGVRNLLDPDHPEATSFYTNSAEVPRMVYAELRFVFK